MRNVWRLLAALCAGSFTGGCAHAPPGSVPGAHPVTDVAALSKSYALIRYANGLRHEPRAALQMEFERLNRRLGGPHDDDLLAKLALLRAIPGTTIYDDEAALNLIDVYLARKRRAGEQEAVEVATFLADELRDRAPAVARACGRASSRAEAKVKRLQGDLDQTEDRCMDLQAKLNELKKLEKSMNELMTPGAPVQP